MSQRGFFLLLVAVRTCLKTAGVRKLWTERLWVAGYSNDIRAYIPSERVLAEGGYEGGGAMVYFGVHGPFRPGVEQRVIDAVWRSKTTGWMMCPDAFGSIWKIGTSTTIRPVVTLGYYVSASPQVARFSLVRFVLAD